MKKHANYELANIITNLRNKADKQADTEFKKNGCSIKWHSLCIVKNWLDNEFENAMGWNKSERAKKRF